MRIDECLSVIDTIKEYEQYIAEMEQDRLINNNDAIADDLRNAVILVSGTLYEMMTEKGSLFIDLLSKDGDIVISDVNGYLHEWLQETEQDAEKLSKHSVVLDYEFERMIVTVERCPEEFLIKRLMSVLTSMAEEMPENFERLITIYSDFAHLWGGFDPQTGNYAHFINGIRAVKENTGDIRWLYNSVEDYRSRKVVYGLINFWLKLDFGYKNSICENNYDDYFDLDILRDKMTDDEVFVDCGAYTGDTAEAYFNNFRQCRKMYLYDMIPVNLDKAVECLEGHDNIVFRNAGVGSPEQAGMKIPVKNAEMSAFSLDIDVNKPNSITRGIEAPEIDVEIVTIDEDIKEKITFLKMDIEGAELEAIKGAKEHILKDHPKLAICTYHHYEHLWEIPKLIRSMSSDYKLYLRYNGPMNGAMASEHVVIAV